MQVFHFQHSHNEHVLINIRHVHQQQVRTTSKRESHLCSEGGRGNVTSLLPNNYRTMSNFSSLYTHTASVVEC